MKPNSTLIKFVIIALGLVFLIASALVLIKVWENRHDEFEAPAEESGVINYNGQDYVYKDNIETFLVLGLDKFRDGTAVESGDGGVRADFIMLFVFDNEKKESVAIQINRDTMAKINKLDIGGVEVDSFVAQIALAYNCLPQNEKIKCRNVKDSVEDLLDGVKIDHYLSFTMDGVPASCELVGGVELTVLDDFTGIDDTLVKGEKITLNGEQALRYVRTRAGLEDSSNSARMLRQQQYINALYDKLCVNMEKDEGFLVKFLDTMDDYVVYDSSDTRMMSFAEKFEDYTFLGVKELEGESKLGMELVEFYPNEEAVKKLVVDLFYTPKKSDNE